MYRMNKLHKLASGLALIHSHSHKHTYSHAYAHSLAFVKNSIPTFFINTQIRQKEIKCTN